MNIDISPSPSGYRHWRKLVSMLTFVMAESQKTLFELSLYSLFPLVPQTDSVSVFLSCQIKLVSVLPFWICPLRVNRLMHKHQRRRPESGRFGEWECGRECQTRKRRGNEKAAPNDKPRDRKNVINAPAVSPSAGPTSLTERKKEKTSACEISRCSNNYQ